MEVCRLQYQGDTFSFQRTEEGDGHWLCVEKSPESRTNLSLNQVLHMALQNDLTRVAITEHKIDAKTLTRYLVKEKKAKEKTLSPLQRKALGKVIKIFKN